MSSRGGIDYSKWDKFQDSSDDEDENDDRASLGAPRVTRFDQPSRITTQADGSVLIQQQEEQQQLKPSEKDNNSSSESTTLKRSLLSSTPPASWTDRGGCTTIAVSCATPTIIDEDTTKNASTVPVYWTQDRYSVTIRIGTGGDDDDSNKKKKKPKYQVQVSSMLSFADRFVATAQQELPVLMIQQQQPSAGGSMTLMLQEALPHPVHLAEDDDTVDSDDDNSSITNLHGNNIDWTLESLGDQKFLSFTLYKAVPMQGLTIWWNRPFKSCPETDISSWRQDSSGSSASFQQAWKEAHTKFQDKMKSQKEGKS